MVNIGDDTNTILTISSGTSWYIKLKLCSRKMIRTNIKIYTYKLLFSSLWFSRCVSTICARCIYILLLFGLHSSARTIVKIVPC